MKALLTLILAAGLCLAFTPNPKIESIVKEYAVNKLGKIESFELFRIDTLTDSLRLCLHQSRINDSLSIYKPVLEGAARLYQMAASAHADYPKDAALTRNYKEAKKEFDKLKAALAAMIKRSDALDRQIAGADAKAFRGYLTQAAIKHYENGNRAVTIYDTATVALNPDLSIIEKADW